MYKKIESIKKGKPREKAIEYGIKNLTDNELLSIILGSGTHGNPVKRLADQILLILDKNNGNIEPDELLSLKGVGLAKATLIIAVMEFSRRILCTSIRKVTFPTDILPAVRHYVTRPQEYFIVLSLNGAHEILRSRVVSIGILNRTLIHPREVFSDAIKDRAASLVLTHNHPSGNLEPSHEDIEVTKRLVNVGNLLGIKVLDHIIFSERDYYSFAENSLL